MTEDEIENLCNYINGDTYTDDTLISSVRLCGNEAIYYINDCYDRAITQRTEVPSYLTNAHNTISKYSQNNIASANDNTYTISSGGHFKVFYDEAENVANLSGLVNLLCLIYDSIDTYLCDIYNFNRPTTDGTYYEIHLIASADINAEGLTPYVSNGRSYIQLSQAKLMDFYSDSDDAFVLGTAIHEYMHAILFSYGIMYSNTEQQCFHEAMGRAAGIEYEISYANHYDICMRIQSYVNSLGYSLGSIDTIDYKYGGALFYLFLFEDYDEWSTIQYLLENYSFSASLLNNIDSMLSSEFDSSFQSAYIHFLSCNVDPDQLYDNSPANRLSSGSNSWGSPNITANHIVTNTSTTFTSNGSIPYSAGHYIKLTPSTYTGKRVTITVTFRNFSGNAIPQAACMVHNVSTGNYSYSGGIVIDNEFYCTSTLSLSSNDVLYIAIANAGTSGTLSYSYSISVSD